MTDELIKVEMVCEGAVALQGNIMGTAFRFIDTGEYFHVRRSKADGTVGAVYQFDMNPERTSMRTKSKRWLRTWDNEEDLLKWRARTDSLELAARAGKALKKGEAASKEEALRVLGPIRRMYHSTDRLGRLALEVAILDYIRCSRV